MTHMKNVFSKIAIDQEICMHCGACVGTCPKNALRANHSSTGKTYRRRLGPARGPGVCLWIVDFHFAGYAFPELVLSAFFLAV